jgi:hypothetical protein
LAVPHWLNMGLLVYRKDLLNQVDRPPPRTWEDVEEISQILKTSKLPFLLLLETQSYDTLLATMFELAWGHGAFWRVTESDNESLTINFDFESSFDLFVQAMERLYSWIHDIKLVPMRSTVDPECNSEVEWAFARHWYSTWIDYRTKRNDRGELFAKFKDHPEFGITTIPISRALKAIQKDSERHFSAWGEWYLAMQRGSENLELGIDLIQNLMTARKITERAWSGAGLPPVEKFYEVHGEQLCPETDKTFNELRQMFFGDARSRTAFQGYRRVARVLSGALNVLLTKQVPKSKVRALFTNAFREIDPDFGPKSTG